MNISVTVESPVQESYRTAAMSGLFDVAPSKKTALTFSAEIPGLDEPWQVSAIVGPSGSGKSTLARKAFGEVIRGNMDWPRDLAVLDGFLQDLPIRDITNMLTQVGFSSPPAWLRPYHVLSDGQKFRCDLARTLLEPRDLIVYDNFTDPLDREVARVCCMAASNAIRKTKKRLVVITPHRDVVEPLEPDWVLDTASMTLARGSVRRGDVEIEIRRCNWDWWHRVKIHHYLSASLHPAATCYLALWNGTPVGFCATLHMMGFKNYRSISRVVVLPDYQGIGIGSRLTDVVAALEKAQGKRISITTSHPAMIAHLKKNPAWRFDAVKKTGNKRQTNASKAGAPRVVSAGRSVATFEYILQRNTLETTERTIP